MLTNIKIKNAYSIGELDMSLLKGKYAYKKDMVFHDVVNPISIYGGNGSGKSSVINALNDLVNLLIQDPDSFYPIIKNFNNKKDNVELELTFRIDNEEYKYSLSNSNVIEKEILLVNNNPIFTRNNERIIIEDKEIKVEGELHLALRQLYGIKDELNNKKYIKFAYDYLTNITIIKSDASEINSKLCNYKNIKDLMIANSEEIKRVTSSWEDFPVYDFLNDANDEYLNLYFENGGKCKLPGFLVSDGMFTINKILSLLINMDRNSVLVIDMIDRNLHSDTISNLIKEAQKRDIQLIFTSHNTNLMQELRPDQIYFAKWKNGYSYYFRLSNIHDNIREINNIEKMYLSNTFDNAINQIINIEE